ncbi:sulfatase-like hydrolase/transferase [Trueperella pecoris]|uniref:Sulfatase-like hydrolase/transferase n=1 Tax=Trueperella pecoris TaxID=2733571 RepID=A0A7M1QVF7_9ACTO|nr:sulfatase-like hydrolase/transferase [Trueperella pecoris]QTG75643.1 sulfatase-like hydrolase/transferase [Trueperella pecoris]
MIVTVQALSVLALGLIALAIFGRNGSAFVRGMASGIVIHAIAFFVLTYGGDVFVYGVDHPLRFVAAYAGLTLAAGLVTLALMALAYRYVLAPASSHWRVWQVFPVILGAVTGGLIALFFFIPKKISDSLDEVTADEILFVLFQGHGSTTPERALEFSNHMVAPVVWFALVGACAGLIRSDLFFRRHDAVAPAEPQAQLALPASRRFRYVRGVALLTMLATLAGSVTYAFQVLPLNDILKQRFETSAYIGDNITLPTETSVQLPEKKRNLVHIYMESIENSFYSKDLGGYNDYNVMPELAELTTKGVSFSHTDKMGGPQQLTAMGHSVAAMVAMNAGVPMLAPGDGNGTLMSYPNFLTTGDYLHAAGYTTDFMLGSDSTWAGLGDYYRRHGNFTVHDLQSFKDEGRIPQDYHVWWGVEDDKLYEYAKDVLTQRGTSDKPFYFILENADTHFPGGLVSPNTEMLFEQQYENVIHYSQAQTVKLVEWMLDQPWAKDTTIVVTGDHRSMDREFFANWDKSYNRTVVNVILNPVQGTDLPASITKNRQYATFDFYPTILAAIGAKIDGERLGLGTNLFSGVPTLVEKDGADLLNEEFVKRSLFYDSHRETVAEKPGNDE